MPLLSHRSLFQAIDHDGSATEIDSKVETLQLALEIFTSKPSSAALSHTVQQAHKILSGLFREEERRRQARAAKALMRAAAGADAQDPDGALDDATDDQGTFADVLHRIARSLDADSAPHRGTPPPTRNLPSSKKGGGGAPSASLAAGVMPSSYLAGGGTATSGSAALFAGAGAGGPDQPVPTLAAPLGGTLGAAALGTGDVYTAPDSSMGLTSLAPAAAALAPVASSLTPDSSWPFSAPGDGTTGSGGGGGLVGGAGGAGAGGFSSAFDAADGLDFGLGAFGFASGDPFGLGLGGDAGLDLEVGGGALGGGGGAGMMGGSGGGGMGALESFAMPDGGQPSWDLSAGVSAQQTVGMTDAEAAAAYWGTGGAGGRSGSG